MHWRSSEETAEQVDESLCIPVTLHMKNINETLRSALARLDTWLERDRSAAQARDNRIAGWGFYENDVYLELRDRPASQSDTGATQSSA
jgi:hypothetical protein